MDAGFKEKKPSWHSAGWLAGVISLFVLVITVKMAAPEPVLYPIRLQTHEKELRLMARFAVTPEEKTKGLMGVSRLQPNEGMLFIYDRPRYLAFWMKNMQMPIDILFIGDDHAVKKIVHQAYPCLPKAVCPRHISKGKVRYVLELPSQYAKKNALELGDKIILN